MQLLFTQSSFNKVFQESCQGSDFCGSCPGAVGQRAQDGEGFSVRQKGTTWVGREKTKGEFHDHLALPDSVEMEYDGVE